jgi:hypothetical protein
MIPRVGLLGLTASVLLAACGSSSAVVPSPIPTTSSVASPTSNLPPGGAYQPLPESAAACPSVDRQLVSSMPDRWKVCSTIDQTAGVLINVSDEIEVFGGGTFAFAPIGDGSPQALVVRAAVESLASDVRAGRIRDPAVPRAGYSAYVLPGERVIFTGGPGTMSQVTAATSYLASTEAAVARTVHAAAAKAPAHATLTPQQYLLKMQNPISKCARDTEQYISLQSQGDARLAAVLSTTVSGGKDCRAAIKLFSVSEDEKAVQKETDNVLTFRFKMAGRHALESKSFWEDFAKLLLTGLEKIH